MVLARLIPAAVAIAIVLLTGVAETSDHIVIDGLLTTNGTLGTHIGILGQGFQDKPKPKVFLTSGGAKVKGTRLKFVGLAPAPGGGGLQQLLVVEVKKASLGAYVLMVQGPKGSTPAFSAQSFQIVPPVADSLSASTAAVGETVVLSAHDVGNRKPKVWIGGKKAKVKEQTTSEGPGVEYLVRIPMTIPNGTWPLTLENKIGIDLMHGAIVVTGSKKTHLGKSGIVGHVDGVPFRASSKKMSSSFDTPQVITVQGLGSLPDALGAQLVCFPKQPAIDGPFPQVYTALPADLVFVKLLPDGDVTWRASDFGSFELHLDTQHVGRVAGSYRGTLIRILGLAPPEFLEVEGRFVGELPAGI
jgi:hypothetical protein